MMSSSLTRGGLVPAKIINLATNEEVPFMFNPNEYSMSKQNTYEKKNVIGQNTPAITFQQGGAISMSLKLYFDTTMSASDVRHFSNKLLKMMMIDTSSESTTTGKGSPPVVAFSWGRVYFKAFITSMTQKFTLFKPDGTPLRCVVDISLEQSADDTALVAAVQAPTGSSSSTSSAPSSSSSGSGGSSSSNGSRTETATQADRIDHVADRGTGDSSNYRDVADKNNVDNPLKVNKGQSYKV
jgi:uncharacterized membrane protein YgcG